MAKSSSSSFPKSSPLAENASAKRGSADVRTAFVAGATGFTGRALAHQDAAPFHVSLRLQVRDRIRAEKQLGDDDRMVEVGLDDVTAISTAMARFAPVDAVVQLVGTVAAKFNDTTSYETVDFQTTVNLLDAAKQNGVKHFILLSSIGAGVGLGSYLAWKKKTEDVVIASGIPATILRPSYLAGDDTFRDRAKVTSGQAFFGGLQDSPLGSPFALVRPIPIQGLARIILDEIRRGPPKSTRILKGQSLFSRIRALDEEFGQ